jgi:hypothetical protein
MASPAEGTLLVTGASSPVTGNAVYSNYQLEGVVEAPGMQPTAVQIRGIAPEAKWPVAGQRLPVTVDTRKPESVVIHWDQIASAADSAMAQAKAEELRLRTGIDAGVLNHAMNDNVAPTWHEPVEPRWSPPAAGPGDPGAGAGSARPGPPRPPRPAPRARRR